MAPSRIVHEECMKTDIKTQEKFSVLRVGILRLLGLREPQAPQASVEVPLLTPDPDIPEALEG